METNRELSINWWRNLSENTKIFLKEEHYPNQKYMTYSDIEKIYNQSIKKIHEKEIDLDRMAIDSH
jgi:hypothetical protein